MAPGGGRPYGVVLSPDGAQIAVGYDDITRVDVLDGQCLAPLFQAVTSGVGDGNLGNVSWSADGRFLYACGRSRPGETGCCRRWAFVGRGGYGDIPLAESTITDLRPLASGGWPSAPHDPSLGVLGPNGKISWRQDLAQADFRSQREQVRRLGRRLPRCLRFPKARRSPAAFDLPARRLTLDPEPDPTLATARTEGPGLEIEDWADQTTPRLSGTPCLSISTKYPAAWQSPRTASASCLGRNFCSVCSTVMAHSFGRCLCRAAPGPSTSRATAGSPSPRLPTAPSAGSGSRTARSCSRSSPMPIASDGWSGRRRAITWPRRAARS